MPNAVTHFLIPAVIVAIFRDFYLSKSKKRKFPLHYILIAGLAGLLPDLDYILYYTINFLGYNFPSHRLFFHNIFFPLIFLIFGFIFMNFTNKEQKKHKLKLSIIFFIISLASAVHLILDALIIGKIMPFYPFSNLEIGFNIIKYLPLIMQSEIMPILDALILACWMIWIELKHKISDFI